MRLAGIEPAAFRSGDTQRMSRVVPRTSLLSLIRICDRGHVTPTHPRLNPSWTPTLVTDPVAGLAVRPFLTPVPLSDDLATGRGWFVPCRLDNDPGVSSYEWRDVRHVTLDRRRPMLKVLQDSRR